MAWPPKCRDGERQRTHAVVYVHHRHCPGAAVHAKLNGGWGMKPSQSALRADSSVVKRTAKGKKEWLLSEFTISSVGLHRAIYCFFIFPPGSPSTHGSFVCLGPFCICG